MDVFKEAGKKYEETKRTFVDGAEAEYVCRSCEEPVADDYDHCPHCGEQTVVPVE